MEFTKINKEFISIQDLMEMTGLSKDKAQQMIRQIKSVSDIWGISGMVHIADYVKYIKQQLDNDARASFYEKR